MTCTFRHHYADVFSVSIICMGFAFGVGCNPKPITPPPPDMWGCQSPPADVFVKTGVQLRFTQSTFSKVATGTFGLDVTPEVISLASQAATDERIYNYVRCLAIRRDGFTNEQATYLDLLRGFIISKPNADQYIQWTSANKFPGELPKMLSDIIIADFSKSDSARLNAYNLSARIESDLRNQLINYGLTDVSVAVVPPISGERADFLAEQGRNKVVIWGWYDKSDLRVRVLFGNGDFVPSKMPEMKEINFELVDEEGKDKELTFVIRKALPSDVTFLSLFVIGHLKYLANEYSVGHRAFDAAMAKIPKNVSLENRALIHFFNARNMQAAKSHDLASIVCEYAQAIKLDSKFYGAYNNLGIIFAEKYSWLENGVVLPDTAFRCLEDVGFKTEKKELEYEYNDELAAKGNVVGDYIDFFSKAEKLQPNVAVLKYNNLAWYWNHVTVAHEWESNEKEELKTKIKPQLDSLLQLDPSIAGAHTILGVIAFDEDSLETARNRFSTALKIFPNSAELHFNLGQVYVREKNLSKAKSEFENSIEINNKEFEAHLALASLAIRDKKFDAAMSRLKKISDEQLDWRQLNISEMTRILKSRIYFETGDLDSTIATLENFISSTESTLGEFSYWAIQHYLLGLLYSLKNNVNSAVDHFNELKSHDFSSMISFLEEEAYLNNYTGNLTWCELNKRCTDDVSRWGETTSCLPNDLKDRIQAVYDLLQEKSSYRLHFRKNVFFGGLACPHVFTYDTQLRNWRWDTTILYKLVGKENESIQRRRLKRFDGKLMIRELEPEISYIDQLYIQIIDENGKQCLLQCQVPALQNADGQYLKLNQGQELLLLFNNYEKKYSEREIWVVTKGYYVPSKNFHIKRDVYLH